VCSNLRRQGGKGKNLAKARRPADWKEGGGRGEQGRRRVKRELGGKLVLGGGGL